MISMADGLESNIDKSIRVIGRAIELTGVDISSKDLHEIGNTIVAELRSEIQNRGDVVTGNLLSSVQVFEETPTSVTLGSDASYAPIYEFGRGPVTPKNAKVLHWIDPHTGEDVFSKYSGPVDGTGVFQSTILKVLPREIERIAMEKARELEKS